MTKSTGKKMGRPPLPPEKKRGQTMGFKPTPNVRKLLQEVAEWNGRSVSKEIEFRLEQSLLGQEGIYEAFGGKKSYEICRFVAAYANACTEDEEWTRDSDKWRQVALMGEFLIQMKTDFDAPPVVMDEVHKMYENMAQGKFRSMGSPDRMRLEKNEQGRVDLKIEPVDEPDEE